MSQAIQPPTGPRRIEAENGETYPSDVYTESAKATGTQREIANRWADGELPTHSTAGVRCKLYTSTGNFAGYQYPDGRGLLEHYSHIEAIRTRCGLIIGDMECYAKGFAHCSKPKSTDAHVPLTSLKEELQSDDESIYDITDVENDVVTFESGRRFDVESWGWVEDDQEQSVKVLGR